MCNRSLAFLCVSIVLLSLFLLSGDPLLAQGIVADARDADVIRRLDDLKKQDAQDLFRLEQASKLKAYPLVIFVPGVLGSKIEECDKVRDQLVNCTPIWGQRGWATDIFSSIDMSIKPSKHYKTTVLDNFKALGRETDFYGSGLAHIYSMAVSDHESLLPYAYDWRQDNRLSALNLHDFLCRLPVSQKARPIVFVAHSMGGLVVKYWFGRIYQNNPSCPDGAPLSLDMRQIIFVGTPHYGAPEAIKAFAQGVKLETGTGVFGFIKNLYSRNTIEAELNRYGTMFPSAYQLLPIYGDACMADLKGKVDLPPPILTHTHGFFDLFSARAWRDAAWPKHIPTDVGATNFYKVHLPKFLGEAREFLCAVARVEFPANVSVVYFSSPAHSTTVNFILDTIPFGNAEATNPKRVGFATTDPSEGDGTVPLKIASNDSHVGASAKRRWIDEKHEYLLNSTAFRYHVKDIYDTAQRHVKEGLLKNPQRRLQLQKVYLKAGAFYFAGLPEAIAASSDPESALADARALFPNTLQFNRSLMELRGLNLTDLWRGVAQPDGREDPAAKAILLALQSVGGERYPDAPVRVVVPAPPGSAPDLVGRVLAANLAAFWGKSVTVDNIPGAAGYVGLDRVAKATPDGHTLVLTSNAPLTIQPTLLTAPSLDPVRDLVPISLVTSVPNILAVHDEAPVQSVRDLIKLAKAQPGKLTYASPGFGTAQHMAGELFKISAGIDIVHVPYRGGSQAINVLLSGQVSMTFGSPATILPLVRDRKLRALAVTSVSRSPLAPDLPTLTELGLRNSEAPSWIGLLAPVGTPNSVVRKVHTATAAALGQSEVRFNLSKLGMDTVASSPEAFAVMIASDTSRWAKLVTEAGLKPK